MKNLLFISAMLLMVNFSIAQEVLNQLDTNGKRQGKWLIYLDKNWKRVDDSTNAEYCRFTFYQKGRNLNAMGPCGRKGWRLETSAATDNGRKIKLLDGEYKWFDEKGRLRFVHVLKNGEYVSYKEYNKSGRLQQEFDYLKLWQGVPHTIYVVAYDKNGQVKRESWYRPENGIWPPTGD